jgi:hypothetical protein
MNHLAQCLSRHRSQPYPSEVDTALVDAQAARTRLNILFLMPPMYVRKTLIPYLLYVLCCMKV